MYYAICKSVGVATHESRDALQPDKRIRQIIMVGINSLPVRKPNRLAFMHKKNTLKTKF